MYLAVLGIAAELKNESVAKTATKRCYEAGRKFGEKIKA